MDIKKIIIKEFFVVAVMMTVVLSFVRCTKEPPVVEFKLENELECEFYVEYIERHYNASENSQHGGSYRGSDSLLIYSTEKLSELKRRMDDVTIYEALELLKYHVDNVRIFRVSDARNIFYSHGNNATKEERYFFTEDAWSIGDEIYNLDGELVYRDYVFKITDELFE